MWRKTPTTIAHWLTILFPVVLMAGHVAADVALSTVALLFLLRSALEKDWRWCRNLWVQLLILLWLYMIARGMLADNSTLALRRALPFVRYIVFAAALACWTLRDRVTRKRFEAAIFFAVLFWATDGMVQSLIGRDLFGHLPALDPHWFLRLTGPFSKPILGIMLAWFYFPACLFLLIRKDGILVRGRSLWIGIAGAIFILAAIFLSGERMALLLTLFGWGMALLLLPLRKSYLLAAFVLGVGLIGLLALASPSTVERQIHSTAYTLEHWQESPYGLLLASDIQLTTENPLFGIGTNQFRSHCEKLYAQTPALDKSACNTHPHNIYMELLIENGAVGLMLFAAFIGALTHQTVQAWPHVRTNPFFIGWYIAVFLRLWPIASTTGFFSAWGAPPFWLAIGVLLAYTAADTEETPDARSSLSV